MERCKDCGQEFEDGKLSRRGLCISCGYTRMRESWEQMTERKGPIYDKYKDGLAKAGRGLKTSKE